MRRLNIKKSIKDVANYKKDTLTGLILAFPKAGDNAREKQKNLSKNIISCKFLSIIWVNSEIIKN